MIGVGKLSELENCWSGIINLRQRISGIAKLSESAN